MRRRISWPQVKQSPWAAISNAAACRAEPPMLMAFAFKVFANFPPGPSPFLGERGKRHLAHSGAVPWQWDRGSAHGQIWLHLVAQGSWAEGDSASALPFLLGDELEQDLVSSSRSTMTSGGASIPKRMWPLATCTT